MKSKIIKFIFSCFLFVNLNCAKISNDKNLSDSSYSYKKLFSDLDRPEIAGKALQLVGIKRRANLELHDESEFKLEALRIWVFHVVELASVYYGWTSVNKEHLQNQFFAYIKELNHSMVNGIPIEVIDTISAKANAFQQLLIKKQSNPNINLDNKHFAQIYFRILQKNGFILALVREQEFVSQYLSSVESKDQSEKKSSCSSSCLD